jgi:predicted phage tail protein
MLLRRDDVNSLVLNKKDILTNSFTPASNLAAGNYRVWIRAINANGILTTWSVAQTFTITAVTPNEEQPAENFLAVSLLSDEPDDVNEIPVLIATTAPDSSPVIEDRPEDTPAELEAITGNEAPATSTVPESVENPIADLIDLAISAWTNRSVDQA